MSIIRLAKPTLEMGFNRPVHDAPFRELMDELVGAGSQRLYRGFATVRASRLGYGPRAFQHSIPAKIQRRLQEYTKFTLNVFVGRRLFSFVWHRFNP